MKLHIVNRKEALGLMLVGTDDAVIQIEDGVYPTLDRPTYVLKADLEARGLEPRANQIVVDYEGFVQLCVDCTKVITW